MCGIAGVISSAPLAAQAREAVPAMLERMRTRGPDGEGRFNADHIAMGMVRLSIIDIAGGQQPLYSEDQSLSLIANGEIYNDLALRRDLHKAGHRFSTGSDCEVILHLYEEYGDACVEHLRGMFAFALWDGRSRRVLLARDRLGEKPLYLFETDDGLIFSSELRSLLASDRVPFELDADAVNHYFHYAYTPDPMCPVAGVRKLPAGHRLAIEVNPWRVEQSCWWRFDDIEPIRDDPSECIRSELESVSRLIIRADVPVGVALSGGLDSSLVAALGARHYGKDLHAFSVGYRGRHECDERQAARQLAQYLGIRFHSVEIDIDQMLDDFPMLVDARDDPIADIAGQGYFSVCRAARDAGVPVLLQGHGGDELFWGYPWSVQAVRDTQRKRQLLDRPWLGRLAYARGKTPEQVGGRLAWLRGLAGMGHIPAQLRRDLSSPADQMIFYDITPDFDRVSRTISTLYSPRFSERLNGHTPHTLFTFPQPWPRVDVCVTRLLIDIYLRENGIAQGDRLSMANSVELRLPLVDHRLVEAVVGLRLAQPDHDQPPKYRLRKAVRGLVPDWVLDRPKRGFSPPTHEWVNALVHRYGSQLRHGYLVEAGVLGPAAAEALVDQGICGFEIMPLVFKALVLEMWCRAMVGQASTPVDVL